MKHRRSFIKSISNKSVRDNLQKPLIDFVPQKQQITKEQEDVDEQTNNRKRWFNFSSSFEVSFNLDKLYFDDEPKQECKELIQVAEKEENKQSNQPLLICLNQLQLTKDQEKIKKQQIEEFENEKKLEECIPNNPNEEPVQSQDQRKHKESLQGYSISEELNSTISLQNHETSHPSLYKNQEIQVDLSLSEEEDSTCQVAPFSIEENLSEIDMLLIQPENMNQYSKSHPLLVSIQDLAKIYPLDLKLYDCVQLNPFQDQKRQTNMFQAFMRDWRQSQNRSSRKLLTLAKIRTLIIRDAMNTLVDIIVPPKYDEQYHLRISKTYRSRYIEAGIQIPPPRVNNSYLEKIFSKPQIKKFYIQYLEERFQIFLQEENFRRIEIYTLQIIKSLSLAENKSVEQLTEQLKRQKKPFTIKELQQIAKEAHQIAHDYGNSTKRIGNGHKKQNDGIQTQETKKKDFDTKINSKGSKTRKKVKVEIEEQLVKEQIHQREYFEKVEKLEWKQSEKKLDQVKVFFESDEESIRKIFTESQAIEEAQSEKKNHYRSFTKSFARAMKLH